MKCSSISVAQSSAFPTTFELPPIGSGMLDGLCFAVKDVIDVAGWKTGCGNPTWRDSHPPAIANAVCVEQLLRAGARCVGKTISDELAFSLLGQNHFYGTPLNPQAADRVPRWVVEWIGFRRGLRSRGFCFGNGHGRLYPRSCEQLWDLGLPAVARLYITRWSQSIGAVV